MSHPAHGDLLGYALDDPRTSAAIGAHVRDCEVCAAETARLRLSATALRQHGRKTAPETPECLDDDAVAALAAGDVPPAERPALEKHVVECPYCRHRIASVARALSDPDVAREVAAVDAGRRGRRLRPWLLVPIAAAAAGVVLMMSPRSTADDSRLAHRAPGAAATAAPTLPVGPVFAAETLRWATVPRADRYRVTLFDATGTVLYERELADTVVALPDSILLAPGRSYLWKVEARTGWNRWAGSKLVEFTIQGDPRR